MLFSRIVRGIIGAIYVFFGAWAIVSPAEITQMTEIPLTTPTAVTDGRAVCGGLTLGLGIAFLLSATRLVDVRTAIAVLFLTLLFAVVARLIGVAVDDGGTEPTFKVMRGEALFMTISAIALFLELRASFPAARSDAA